MKSVAAVVAVALVAASAPEQAAAFSAGAGSSSSSSSFAGASIQSSAAAPQNAGTSSLSMEYIPSGMSKAQWAKIKEAEKNKNKGKNLGKVGITSFKSRTFSDWQKAGGKNLFPVDPNKVKDASEIPYMQRQGGRADDSDLKKGGGGGGGMFGMFGKKKAPEPEPEPEEPKKTNWWTL